MQYKYNERHLNHIVIYCCYSILESLTYSLNCVWNFLRVYCINRIQLQSNVMNTINKVTFLNYWSIPPISDSTNSWQNIRNWLPNVGSDSLAEKWQSHLALTVDCCGLFYVCTKRRRQQDHYLFTIYFKTFQAEWQQPRSISVSCCIKCYTAIESLVCLSINYFTTIILVTNRSFYILISLSL